MYTIVCFVGDTTENYSLRVLRVICVPAVSRLQPGARIAARGSRLGSYTAFSVSLGDVPNRLFCCGYSENYSARVSSNCGQMEARCPAVSSGYKSSGGCLKNTDWRKFGRVRSGAGEAVRPPAASIAELRDCAEFVFESHNARLTLAKFVARRSWDKVQKKYRWEIRWHSRATPTVFHKNVTNRLVIMRLNVVTHTTWFAIV